MDKKQIAKVVYEKNLTVAGRDMLDIDAPRILKPTPENLRKFREQQSGMHSGCGCFACIELGKMFVRADHDLNEIVIGVSTKELERK